jgi:hypothetical protein
VNEVLAEVGAYSSNPRFSWSAIEERGKPAICVLFLWADRVVARFGAYGDTNAAVLRMDNTGIDHFKASSSGDRKGSNQLFRHLLHAQDECDSRFRVMWLIRDPEHPNTVKERYLDPNLVMEVKFLDTEVREFRAESVEGWNGAPPPPPTKSHTTEAAAIIGSKGGKARAANRSAEERSVIARKGAETRWKEMRVSRKGNTVYARVGFWYDEEEGKIHMTFGGIPNGHVAVHPDPSKRQGHPTLFRRLEKALRDRGAPAPNV